MYTSALGLEVDVVESVAGSVRRQRERSPSLVLPSALRAALQADSEHVVRAFPMHRHRGVQLDRLPHVADARRVVQ